MSKIIKKSDITNLVESTMKQAGILKEDEEIIEVDVDENEVIEEVEEVEDLEEDCDLEESEDLDVVAESTKKLAGQAGEHNLISENLKKDLASFNKIINYKY